MLEPFLCGLPAQAPLLPKLRGHFAEFLDNASPVGLGILSPSTCVGLRYGCVAGDSGFSRHALPALRYFCFAPRRSTGLPRGGFASPRPPLLAPGFPLPARGLRMRPHSSAATQYRNLRLLSIGCAFRPRLRPRLPQGRPASPWKPWISGRGDSHPPLATHSGILSSRPSTAPSGAASPGRQCSPTDALLHPAASAACFSPGNFRRGASRPVSCYALFQCMAASEPTSWLSLKPHILSHLTRTWGP